MEHRRVSYWLMGAGALATAAIALVFFLFAPVTALSYRDAYPALAHLFWPGLAFVWCIGLLYGAAMIEYFRVCRRVGQDRSFCMENAVGLARIALLLAAAGGLWLAGMGLALLQPGIHFAPWCLWLLLACAASLAMAVLAWGLGRLLRRAVEIKEDNDLTV